MSAPAAERTPVEGLMARFELEPLDRDLFLGDPGPGRRRLFGGLVAAQSFMAAARTLEAGERPLHSLHAYFLRPGRYELPIRFVVDRIRDGRSFTTRRVVAHQGGEAIFNLSASFAAVEEGVSHQDAPPESPPPEELPLHRSGPWAHLSGGEDSNPIEMRSVDGLREDDQPLPPHRIVWMRPRGVVDPDPVLQTALLVYASDRSLVSTAVRPLPQRREEFQMASLDHALWLHRPVRFDDWLQFVSESPVAHSARGLIFGAVYDRKGARIASVAQEGLVRLRRDRTE